MYFYQSVLNASRFHKQVWNFGCPSSSVRVHPRRNAFQLAQTFLVADQLVAQQIVPPMQENVTLEFTSLTSLSLLDRISVPAMQTLLLSVRERPTKCIQITIYYYIIWLLHVSAHYERHPQGAQCNPDEIDVRVLHHESGNKVEAEYGYRLCGGMLSVERSEHE
jgi:hypothetical protein